MAKKPQTTAASWPRRASRSGRPARSSKPCSLTASQTAVRKAAIRQKNVRKLDPAILEDIVARIVKVAQPEKIILFGSAARGEMGPNSDVDLLVIKSGPVNRGRLVEQLYMQMDGADEAVDIVVATPEELREYGNSPWLVLAPALKEGRVVYAA